MNTRILTTLAVVALLGITGCNGAIRNCLFGPGAPCGGMATFAPQYQIAPPTTYPGNYMNAECGCGYETAPSSTFNPTFSDGYNYNQNGTIEGVIPNNGSSQWIPRNRPNFDLDLSTENVVPGSMSISP